MLNSSYYRSQMSHYQTLLDKITTKIENFSTYLEALKTYQADLLAVCEKLNDAEDARKNGGYTGEELKVNPDLLSGDAEDLAGVIDKVEAKIEEFTVTKESYQTNYNSNSNLYYKALELESGSSNRGLK